MISRNTKQDRLEHPAQEKLPKMSFTFAAVMALVWIVSGTPAQQLLRPSLEIPACPTTGSLSYNASVPDSGLFPLTQVDLCYDDSSIHVKFTAYEEKDFYCNAHLITRSAGFHLPPWGLDHANSRLQAIRA